MFLHSALESKSVKKRQPVRILLKYIFEFRIEHDVELKCVCGMKWVRWCGNISQVT